MSFRSAGYLIKGMMFTLPAPPGWFCQICCGRTNRNKIFYYFIQYPNTEDCSSLLKSIPSKFIYHISDTIQWVMS